MEKHSIWYGLYFNLHCRSLQNGTFLIALSTAGMLITQMGHKAFFCGERFFALRPAMKEVMKQNKIQLLFLYSPMAMKRHCQAIKGMLAHLFQITVDMDTFKYSIEEWCISSHFLTQIVQVAFTVRQLKQLKKQY